MSSSYHAHNFTITKDLTRSDKQNFEPSRTRQPDVQFPGRTGRNHDIAESMPLLQRGRVWVSKVAAVRSYARALAVPFLQLQCSDRSPFRMTWGVYCTGEIC